MSSRVRDRRAVGHSGAGAVFRRTNRERCTGVLSALQLRTGRTPRPHHPGGGGHDPRL